MSCGEGQAHRLAPAASAVLDATTGIPSMIADVQTIFSGNASTLDKVLAGGDLLLNVLMDATMVIGVGEGLKAAYVGVKAAAHVAEDVGAHAIEHAGEDAVEHVAAHAAEDAAEHAGEQGVEDGAEEAACALSFAAATLVATPSGERAIASIKPGDKVSAYDPATGKASTQTVAATSVHQDANLVDVTLRVGVPSRPSPATHTSTGTKGTPKPDAGASQTATTMHDETVHTTANHPWLTADAGWLPAGFLRVGEPVQELDGAGAVVVSVRAVAGVAAMDDLSLDSVHTFAVGDGQFVVHNACTPVNPGDAGAYEDLLGTKGDGLTPHHMPQGSLAEHFGFDYNRGGTIVMDAATHSRTFSYGGKAIGVLNRTIREGLAFRDALAESIRDYRSLVPNSNRSVRELLGYWREYRPDLMAKP